MHYQSLDIQESPLTLLLYLYLVKSWMIQFDIYEILRGNLVSQIDFVY